MRHIPNAELRMTASRASGPGGQNVNKVATKVTLHWNVRSSRVFLEEEKARILARLSSRVNRRGELMVRVEKARNQSENRFRARALLEELIAGALRMPKARKKTKIPRTEKEKRLRRKKILSEKKRARRAAAE